MKKRAIISIAAAISQYIGVGALAAAPPGRFFFPDTANGEKILPLDSHLHTIWSDGYVWPTVRVDEARREGIAAIAITDHMEGSLHGEDLPKTDGFLDLNRSFAIASGYAKGDVQVIHGVEISRGFGHFNCLYTTDNNRLRVPGRKPNESGQYQRVDDQGYREAVGSITTANEQGAFCIWNHPYAPGQREKSHIALGPIDRELISSGKVKGIEVVNGSSFLYDAVNIALDNNLAMFAASDSHAPVDLSSQLHRSVTLVIARDASESSIREALEKRKTVALYRDTLIGSAENVGTIVQSALKATSLPPYVDPARFKTSFYPVEIENHSSMPMIVELDKALKAFNLPMVTIPAYGKQRFDLFVAPIPSDGIRVRVLNSVTRDAGTVETVLPLAAAR